MNTHTINSILLDFSFDKNEKNTALQKTKCFFEENVLPLLSNRFDEEQADIYIDKLEIDIGKTTENDFAEKFLSAFKQSWDNYSFKKAAKSSGAAEASSGLSIDQLFYYLENGYWSWNVQQKPGAEIIKLVHSYFSDNGRLLHFIRQLNKKNEIVITRLIDFVFSNKVIIPLFIEGLIQYHSAWKEVETYFDTSWQRLIEKRKGFYYLLLKEIIISSAISTVIDVKDLLVKIEKKYRTGLVSPSIKKLESMDQLVSEIKKINQFADIKKIISLFKNADKDEPTVVQDEMEIIGLNAESIINKEEEKITIANAGLILFHPYLSYVFKELKWINSDNKFSNKKNQQKAILFLQYLINQKSRQPEHLLVLNKIMCGWPVNMPLTAKVNFSKKEKQVAVELCESLKEHWKVIQNTSYEGLIKSFIERKGIIKRMEDGFLLKIEKISIDVLMESLPFGIQLIKFPWNEYIIHTEWAY